MAADHEPEGSMSQPPDDRRPLPWEPEWPAGSVPAEPTGSTDQTGAPAEPVALIFLGGQVSQILSAVGTSI